MSTTGLALDGAVHVVALRDEMAARSPIFKGTIDQCVARFGQPWVEEFDATRASVFDDREELGRAAAGYAAFAVDLMRRQVEFDHPLGDRMPQRRAGAEIERGGPVRHPGARVDLQVAQALGALLGKQLDRLVAQFAAALVRIGLASLLYAGSLAAVHRRF